MTLEPPSLLLPLTTIAFFSIAMTGYILIHHRSLPRIKFASLIILGGAIWLIFSAFEMGTPFILEKTLFKKMQYIGVLMIPSLWFMMCLDLSGRTFIANKKNSFLLLIFPTLTLILVYTNEIHGLFWSQLSLNSLNPFLPLTVSFGFWYWLTIAYSYLLIFAGAILIGVRLIHFRDLYRRQSLPLLLGALTPWAIDIIYRTNPSAFLYLNPAPIVITLVAMILLWRMVQLQATDVIPVAHRIIMDSMGESVILLDSKNRIVDLNPSAQNIIGQDLSKALAKPIEEIWKDWKIIEKIIENKESSKEVFIGEKYQGRFFDIRFYSLTGVTSRLGSRLIVMRDVTERRMIEDERKKTEAAQKLIEYKDRFISTATHELKTPIAVIKGYVEYLHQLKSEIPYSEMKANLEVVKRNTDQLLKITDELLDIRRMQTGKMPLIITELNFKELIEDCMKDVKPLIYKKKHQVSVDISSQIIPILGDRTKLRQVVLNIVTNAIKFTPEGGAIKISLKDEDDFIKFEVSDTGIGITKGDLNRVFEPFAIIDKPTYVKGAGLGLSITKGIVQLHKGTITAESRGIGKGATFRIIFPKMKVAPPTR